jgi:hypothetical protein
MRKIDLSEFVVRSGNGMVDVDATMSELARQVLDMAAKEAELNSNIETAVCAVFDENIGKALPMPYVVNTAISLMGVSPSEYAIVSRAIARWIHTCGQFSVDKGKGGGVRRVTSLK